MELTDGQDQGKSSDPKYAKVTRKYEDRVAGEPYVTAEFANNNEKRTSFPVGDGKYYSTEGVTDAKRKRRKGESIDLTSHNQSDMTFELILYMRKKNEKNSTSLNHLNCVTASMPWVYETYSGKGLLCNLIDMFMLDF